MKYKIYRQGSYFCLGIIIAPCNDSLGACALYWNSDKKSFVDDATHCWRKSHKEDEVLAEFFRINSS